MAYESCTFDRPDEATEPPRVLGLSSPVFALGLNDRVGLAQKYNQFAGEGAKRGLIKGGSAQHRNVRHRKGVGWSVSDDR